MDYIDFSPREEGSCLREKGNKFSWETISPMKQIFKYLTKKIKFYFFLNQKIYIIEKLLKHKYIKWFYFFNIEVMNKKLWQKENLGMKIFNASYPLMKRRLNCQGGEIKLVPFLTFNFFLSP